MSMTQTVIGSAFVAGTITLVLQAFAPEPPPITVHSLIYSDGIVTQDRTVTGDAEVFWMQWSASVVDPATHLPVGDCKGSGSWNYPTGRIAPKIPLVKWVGNDDCQIPTGRPVQLLATYTWGDRQVTAKSDVFQLP